MCLGELVNDVTFGILVEQVNTGHVESNVYDVACTSGGTSGYTSGHGSFFGNQVQIDFSTHKFGNFYVAFDYGVRHSLQGSSIVVDTFGTYTGNDFLAYVILQSGISSLVSRQLQSVGTPKPLVWVRILVPLQRKISKVTIW